MRKTQSAARGQTLITETSPDRYSSHKVNENQALMGKTMKGGRDDVSHSVSGSTATGDYNDTK